MLNFIVVNFIFISSTVCTLVCRYSESQNTSGTDVVSMIYEEYKIYTVNNKRAPFYYRHHFYCNNFANCQSVVIIFGTYTL